MVTSAVAVAVLLVLEMLSPFLPFPSKSTLFRSGGAGAFTACLKLLPIRPTTIPPADSGPGRDWPCPALGLILSRNQDWQHCFALLLTEWDVEVDTVPAQIVSIGRVPCFNYLL